MLRTALLAMPLSLLFAGAVAVASGNALTPSQVIVQARAAAPTGITGTFEMPVLAIELYSTSPRLHSERDHENGKALSIHVSEAAHRQLAARLGADYTRTLKGKRIRVTGTAKRFHVASFAPGGTGTGFEQTIVELDEASRLQVL